MTSFFFVARAFSIRFHPQVSIRNIKPAFQSLALELKLSLRLKVLQWSRGAAAGTNLLDLLNVFGRCKFSTPLCSSLQILLSHYHWNFTRCRSDLKQWSRNCQILGSFSTILKKPPPCFARVRFPWPPCNISPLGCPQTNLYMTTYWKSNLKGHSKIIQK